MEGLVHAGDGSGHSHGLSVPWLPQVRWRMAWHCLVSTQKAAPNICRTPMATCSSPSGSVSVSIWSTMVPSWPPAVQMLSASHGHEPKAPPHTGELPAVGLAQVNIHTPKALKDAFRDLPPIFKASSVSQDNADPHMVDHCWLASTVTALKSPSSAATSPTRPWYPLHCCAGTCCVVWEWLAFMSSWSTTGIAVSNPWPTTVPRSTGIHSKTPRRPRLGSLPSCSWPACMGNAVRTRCAFFWCTSSSGLQLSRPCGQNTAETWPSCRHSLCPRWCTLRAVPPRWTWRM